MKKDKKDIPIRSLDKDAGNGIAVAKVSSEVFHSDEETRHPHRHNYHFFVLQEKGTSHTEIDFEDFLIEEPTILYQSPHQVHRALYVKDIEMYILVISSENINADHLGLLQSIAPVKPLALDRNTLDLVQKSFSLCVTFYKKNEDRLSFSLLRDSCNTLIALIISLYVKQLKPVNTFSRFERIERLFRRELEQHYSTLKRPAEYAKQLNISVSYLNECIKNVTGFPVSHHIRQRIILEAKRLLYHSDKSVKEIAAEIGYDDYAYFVRVFKKVTGQTALAFRNKNRD